MRFVNPYNFIPLTGKKKLYENHGEETLTGKIVVEIKTKTPLFIPDTSNEKVFPVKGEDPEHKSYDFFTYGKEPVIPGSEIRGMIRSVYEALTGSCLSAIDDDAELVKRTNDIYQPGLIKKIKGKYILVEAERSKCRDKDFKKIGQKTNNGYFLRGEKGFRGIAQSYFNPIKPEKKVCDIKDEHFKMIDIVLKSYQNSKTNKHLTQRHGGYVNYEKEFNAFKKSEKDGYFPIYYSKATDNLIYLSPACITKEAYVNKISDIISTHGNFGPCTGDERCPACALFGTINEKSATASSLRFADAKLVKDANQPDELFWKSPVTLEELGQPKIAATEFYLKQPNNAKFWTYDYYVDNKGNIHEFIPEIAGRKFYWHNPRMQFKANVERTKRNKTVRPLKRNVVFEEEIYFERITKEQLQQMLAICNISNEYVDKKGNEDAGYKLGTGRPLGLGSISMKVKSCSIRSLSCDETGISYKEEPFTENGKIADGEKIGFCKETIAPFVKMMRFNGAGNQTICYPVTDEQLVKIQKNLPHTEGFKWFQQNHGKLAPRKRSIYKETLPKVTG